MPLFCRGDFLEITKPLSDRTGTRILVFGAFTTQKRVWEAFL